MKKLFSLLLVFAICLSLCACMTTAPTPTEETLDLKSTIVGNWEYDGTALISPGAFSDPVPTPVTYIYHIYKGGPGLREMTFIREGEEIKNSDEFTWEITEDDVINISTNDYKKNVYGYTYEPVSDTLVAVDSTHACTRRN